MKQITIILRGDGDFAVLEVPEGIEVLVIDEQDGGHANFGEGDNNILSQKC